MVCVTLVGPHIEYKMANIGNNIMLGTCLYLGSSNLHPPQYIRDHLKIIVA